MEIETTPEIDECVVVIQPVVEGELRSWGLVSKYSFDLNDYIVACKTAIEYLVLDDIKNTNSLYQRLKKYLALSILYGTRVRSEKDYEQISSGDYQIKMQHSKIKDVQFTEERRYIQTNESINDYTQTEISALGSLANKYNSQYLKLRSMIREKKVIARVIKI